MNNIEQSKIPMPTSSPEAAQRQYMKKCLRDEMCKLLGMPEGSAFLEVEIPRQAIDNMRAGLMTTGEKFSG